MPLADALAPEGIVFPIRQNCLGNNAVERKHARIPAHGDNSDGMGLSTGRVHPAKVLRDFCMGVEAVDHVEILRKLRRLLRQIVRTAAAEDHHVNLIPKFSASLMR